MTKKTTNKTKMILSSLLAGGLLIGSAGCPGKAPDKAAAADGTGEVQKAASSPEPKAGVNPTGEEGLMCPVTQFDKSGTTRDEPGRRGIAA